MIPLPYLALTAVLLVASAYGLGRFHGASGVRQEVEAAEARTEALAAKLQAKQANETVRVVTEYVDRERVIERNVPVVRERLIRVCNDANRPGVPGAARPADASARADASRGVDHSHAAFAQDLIECRASAERLRALQAWVRANQAP